MSDRADLLKEKLKKLGLTNSLISFEKVEEDCVHLSKKTEGKLFVGLKDEAESTFVMVPLSFVKLLDEAKAEYLGLNAKWKKKHPHPEVTDYHADALAQMREDWFKRWFGGV